MQQNCYVCVGGQEDTDITTTMDRSYEQTIERSSFGLKAMVEWIVVRGKQNLTIRDHTNSHSN